MKWVKYLLVGMLFILMAGCQKENTTVMEKEPEQSISPGENAVQVPIRIRGKDETLKGCLTMPEDLSQKPKVVIFVHGSGQSDMNESAGTAGNAPFRDMAEGLAARGIASLRYNKRYYEHADHATEDVTIQDEVLEDVQSAILYLEELGCCSDIYIVGHSMGGMLAPVIAKQNDAVKGIICMAGTPRTLQELVYDQNKEALEQSKELSAKDKETQMSLIRTAVDKINSLTETDSGNYLGIPACYWYSLNQLHHGEAAKELTIPILILQGSEDFQVYPEKDYEKWKELLSDKENVTFRLYDGLNHLFMKSNGKRDVTEYDVASKVSEDVISDMAEWVAGN